MHRLEILLDQSLATKIPPSEILSPCHLLPVRSSTLHFKLINDIPINKLQTTKQLPIVLSVQIIIRYQFQILPLVLII